MISKIQKIWQDETNQELENASQIQVFEENMQKKVLHNYHKHFSMPNQSYSLEVVQIFSLRSIFHEYEIYSDPHPLLLFRKRILLIVRLIL